MWADRAYADEPPAFRRFRPLGTWWLIGINVASLILFSAAGGLQDGRLQVVDALGVSWQGLLGLKLWQPITYQFVHGGLWHLAWNMLLLFFAGRLLEELVGTRRFILVYLGIGAFAGVMSCVVDPGWPVIGASGSVLGVFVALALKVPNLPVNLIFFTARLKWVALVVIGIDLLKVLPVLVGGVAGNQVALNDRTAHWAHLFGALGGVAWAWFGPRVALPWMHDLARRRARRREVEKLERSLNEERELDRILDKISRDGMPSLTEAERSFLARVSDKYQSSRRP